MLALDLAHHSHGPDRFTRAYFQTPLLLNSSSLRFFFFSEYIQLIINTE